MKYLRLILIIFFINIAKLGYADTQSISVKPSDYLYVPLVYTNESQPSSTSNITFEQMFYSALANTLGLIYGETNCESINSSGCPNINYIYKNATSNPQTSGWGQSSSFYPKLILLSDLDYNVTATGPSKAVSWDTIQSNSWSVMPESEVTDVISFPCGFAATNYFNLINNGQPMNRAQELSYFCYPGEGSQFGENTMQSYINKSYETDISASTKASIMRPMFVSQGVTTLLSPVGDKNCDAANNYDTSNPKTFWGFPFRGQQCSDTKLENLYFMIIEQVD